MNRIKEYRQQARMTQQDLASELGCEQSTVSNYENGRTPDLSVCRGIVAVFRVRGLNCGLDDVFPAEPDEDTDAA